MESQNDSENFFSAWSLLHFVNIQMAIRTAIQVKVFDIIDGFGPESQVSAAEMVANMVTTDPAGATVALERVLRMLSVNSILTSALRPPLSDRDADRGGQVRVYGLTNKSRCFVSSARFSLADFYLFVTDRETLERFYSLRDAVLEPGAHAYATTNMFEGLARPPEMSRLFNGSMSTTSRVFLNEILKVYRGFDDVMELMDVGGGMGTTLDMIVSRHPGISGINFDLPHVIAQARDISGVKHVAGDMFKSLPNAQTIILKWIIHDWDDDRCKTLLRNCWEALPENGKVVVMEYAIPEVLESNAETQDIISMDFQMMVTNPGGKERTVAEFVALANASGFVGANIFPIKRGIHVLEFLKKN